MRKNKSLLNNWVLKQSQTRKVIAKKIGISYGSLKMFLVKGFVTKGRSMEKVTKATGISIDSLVAERNLVLGIEIDKVEAGEIWDREQQKYIPVENT